MAAIQARKWLKQLLNLIVAEADAAVGNTDTCFARPAAYRYLHLAPGRRVLDRISNQIGQQLVEAFANQKNGRSYALENIKFFTSVMSHYVSDGHVPFHAITNYDGQLSGQHGVHARFETELFERYEKKLKIQPPARVDVSQGPREFLFATLTESARLAEGVLAADKAAIGSGDIYDRACALRASNQKPNENRKTTLETTFA